MTEKTTTDYLVIGSGLAALSVSALLARAGNKVTLLEAHTAPGGYAHTFEVDHFEFCAQVHYIWGCAPGQTLYEFLKKLNLQDEVTFQAFNPMGYDVASLPDGKRVGIPYGFDQLLIQLDAAYPGERANIKEFLDIIAQLKYEISQLPRHIRWWHVLTHGMFARTTLRLRHKTLQAVFDQCHLSKEAQAVLSCQAGDLGASPDTLSILAYASLFAGYNEGAYYPTKHFKFFIDALVRVITENPECNIIYGAKVEQIDTDDQRVVSVTTHDGVTYTADQIICNMDPKKAATIIGFDKFPERDRESLKYDYSPSSFIVYLGLSGIDLRDHGFTNANIWHLPSWDVNAMWRNQLAGDLSDPWLFISSPYLRTPDLGSTPAGCQNLEVGTVCSYEQFADVYHRDHDAYVALKNTLAETCLDVLEQQYVPNIRSHIVSKTIGTPITNETFCGATRGNCYGSMMTPQNMGLSRLQSRTPWKNFYWCNASGGYAGTHGTILTGINLYTDLTGDAFLPTRHNLPTTQASIEYALSRAFVK